MIDTVITLAVAALLGSALALSILMVIEMVGDFRANRKEKKQANKAEINKLLYKNKQNSVRYEKTKRVDNDDNLHTYYYGTNLEKNSANDKWLLETLAFLTSLRHMHQPRKNTGYTVCKDKWCDCHSASLLCIECDQPYPCNTIKELDRIRKNSWKTA